MNASLNLAFCVLVGVASSAKAPLFITGVCVCPIFLTSLDVRLLYDVRNRPTEPSALTFGFGPLKDANIITV